MLIPDQEKKVKTLRIPQTLFNSILFIATIIIIFISILTYDYMKVVKQVYINKHLTIENNQLKEQLQLFNININSLTQDLDRIKVFEKKLRHITGLKNIRKSSEKIPKEAFFPDSKKKP